MDSLSSSTAYLLPPLTAVHPPDLDTDDPSLATEVLPAPPPLVSLSSNRRDSHLRRPANIISYLPASDPGSTYSGLMGGLGLSLVPEDDGRLRKRLRVDKTAINNRAQRASARNLTPTVPPPAPSPPQPHHAPSADPPGPKTRDKGKAREKPPPRVKEEPQAVSLSPPEPPSTHPNDDHCSACRSHGALVYCDGCPRAFHLWCLDPPLDAQDVPEHRWYCPACVVRQHPPPKPRRSLLSPLLYQLSTSIPAEFELPDDIRSFFKDVATGPQGAYQDSSETKIVRSSRFTVQDEREPFRLKDRNGAPILCFRCGKSALPDNDTASSSSSSARETRGRRSLRAPPGEVLWKSIVSCDHCSLHWHLDCLDPPLSSMPPTHKKWMCPTHVDHIAPKRRVPKHAPPVTDVTQCGRPNNGNIEIIPADTGADKAKTMPVDEVHINGRRYRIPERVIVLDFWDSIRRARRPLHPAHALLSGLSSPLTSLDELEGIGPSVPFQSDSPSVSPEPPASPAPDAETMRAVELLFACRTAVVQPAPMDVDVDVDATPPAPPVAAASQPGPAPPAVAPRPAMCEMAVQTEPEGCVKLDVHDAKQLSGLITATLQDLERTEPPSPSPPRPVRALPRRAPRKSAREPADVGNTRVTRSQVASSSTSTSSASAPAPAPPPPPRSKTETALPAPAPAAGPTPRATRSMAAASVAAQPPAASPGGTPRPKLAVRTTDSPAAPAKAPKTEPEPTTLPPSPHKSPFKIRIPLAMNAAVAAATAAAAASSSSAPAPGEDDSDLSSGPEELEPEPRITPTRTTLARLVRRASHSPIAPPRSPPARARRTKNPFDQSPQYTDATSDSSSEYDPGPRMKGFPSPRMVPLPRGLGI